MLKRVAPLALALVVVSALYAHELVRRGWDDVALTLPPGASWGPNPFLARGSQLAVVAGNPMAGGAYAMRITFPDGFVVMPHSHPDERIYTVLAGSFEIGMGVAFDTTRLAVSAPGEVIRLPAGMPHFHRASSGAVEFQVNGVGPTGIAYVDPAHDPRSAGAAPR